ncbi:hypothetical protein NDU88_003972 [Pleurodeles waltl]|uniref:Uncharacterized protein n=1 Tax=Pleurodeles waltl TaxID=8319 RepID=A0AAV7M4Y6_PLEWA|nr:hypothetical protein NDU88_003972 [Pleurodeles waltl]
MYDETGIQAFGNTPVIRQHMAHLADSIAYCLRNIQSPRQTKYLTSHDIYQTIPQCRVDFSGVVTPEPYIGEAPGVAPPTGDATHLSASPHKPPRGEARKQSDIVEAFRDHLERVYANPGNPQQDRSADYLAGVSVPQLGMIAIQALDSYLTLEEVRVAIKSLPLSKSPGSDGFTAEFNQVFGPDLASCS